jgi:hypothetical protein
MKTIWVNREGLLKNRVRSQQYTDPVLYVSVGDTVLAGYGLRLLGPSRFAYLDLQGRYALQLETDGPVELEVKRGEWKLIP